MTWNKSLSVGNIHGMKLFSLKKIREQSVIDKIHFHVPLKKRKCKMALSVL